jgi:hypothetical protein
MADFNCFGVDLLRNQHILFTALAGVGKALYMLGGAEKMCQKSIQDLATLFPYPLKSTMATHPIAYNPSRPT